MSVGPSPRKPEVIVWPPRERFNLPPRINSARILRANMKTIRVDDEVYRHTLRAKHLLEVATGRTVSFTRAVSFLMALHLDEGVDTVHGNRHTLIYEVQR